MIQQPAHSGRPETPARSFDVLVIGAGPAGANAAMAAASTGLDVGLLDEAPAAGGQVWRAPPLPFAPGPTAPHNAEAIQGAAMRAALQASAVHSHFGRRVWNLRPGFEAHAVGPQGAEAFAGRALILSPGTYERIVPFEGWTLPGIVGLGAATVLLKSQGVLPGRRTVVAGAGPLLIAVANSILKAGGEVAAIVDLNGPGDWLRATPQLAGRPDLVLQGMQWLARIVRSGVRYYPRHAVLEAHGTDRVEGIDVVPVNRDWRPDTAHPKLRLEADAVAVGHGLTPATEMTRLLGAEHRFDADFAEWAPILDAVGQTSVANLFVAGDASGVWGAAAAVEAGRQAGFAAARALGATTGDTGGNAGRLRRSRRFGRAMTRLTAPRPGLAAAIAPQTVVCRCEDVTRADIDAAARDGARAIGQLKAWTRCSMGPCQGRMCGETVGMLMDANGVPRQQFGQMVARPPLRPVGIEALVGDFDYADIALPPSLPTS